jgi:ribosome maturation protein Sdo1
MANKNQLLLGYYDVLFYTRDNIKFTCDKISYQKCNDIFEDIHKYYNNYNNINKFTIKLSEKLNSKYETFSELNDAIINKLKIFYTLNFDSSMLEKHKQNIIPIFNQLMYNRNEYNRNKYNKISFDQTSSCEKEQINQYIQNVMNDTIYKSIKQLNISDMEEFKKIFNTNNQDEIFKLKLQYDELKLQYDELKLQLDKKEKRISILESEIFPIAY